MSTHEERMRDVSSLLRRREGGPPKGAMPVWESPKAARMEAKRKFGVVASRITRTLGSGAGLLTDQQIRYFFNEYNTRLVEHGVRSLPSSFNVLEAFVRYDEDLYYFHLLPEKDHLFSFSDFIDFVTSADAPPDPFEAARRFEEDTIYSYSVYDDPHDLTFTTRDSNEFGVAGVSMVRSGDELALMLLAGKITDLEEESKAIKDLSVDFFAGRRNIKPHPDHQRAAEGVGDFTDLWKTIVLVRMDLASKVELVHYVLTDMGDGFNVVLDDPEAFSGLTRDPHKAIEAHRDQLASHAVLFELCKTALLLPAYFAFKYVLIRDEPGAAAAASPGTSRGGGSRRSRHSQGERVVYRRISALRVVSTSARTVRRFTAPQFRVEVDGFWRDLGPGRVGKGPGNEPSPGRTWVRGHLRWRDLPERPLEILVKSRLAIARATVEAEALLKSVVTDTPHIEPVPAPESHEPVASVSREEAYRQRRLLTPRLRWRILQRDDFRCLSCGADAAGDRSVRLDVDHIVAIANGGKTVPENLRTLCSRCNNGKGDLIM